MSERDALLFANEAFYLAFREGDVEIMIGMWADDEAITCIHPGWNPLIGSDAVLSSWESILTGSARPDVWCRSPSPSIFGQTGVVVCFEEIDDEYLVATNVFVRQKGGWRLVHHQAGPAGAAPEETPEGEPQPLN
jgi:hypothetical protein